VTTASTIQTEDLAGKRALVSGGTRGTGAAVVARLKRAGAHVTAVGRHPAEPPIADEFLPADISSADGTDKSDRADGDQLPYTSVTVLAAGHSPSCSRRSASGPRLLACEIDQS
jgi:NAD(P)-dependent dehydrogenase (short-subunit alcohol dehydrogenase family)